MFIFLFLTAAVSLFAEIQGIVLLGGEREVFSKEELAGREGIWAEGMALSGKLEGRLARYLEREMEGSRSSAQSDDDQRNDRCSGMRRYATTPLLLRWISG